MRVDIAAVPLLRRTSIAVRGSPTRVVGIVDGESRGPKIRVFKKKRRKGMRVTKGHRSTYTVVRVTDILV